jgi:hypothetical protein
VLATDSEALRTLAVLKEEARLPVLRALELLGAVVMIDYVAEGALQKLAVLDPQWLTRVLSSIVTVSHHRVRM